MAAGMISSDKSSSTSSLSEPKRSRGANKHYIGKGNVVFTGTKNLQIVNDIKRL